MSKLDSKVRRRQKVKKAIRAKIKGTQEIPRLAVYKSNQRINAFLVDDNIGKVLTSVSSISIDNKLKNFNIETSKKTGELIANKAKALGIQKVVFDRSGYLYHGNVKALAESARNAGLVF